MPAEDRQPQSSWWWLSRRRWWPVCCWHFSRTLWSFATLAEVYTLNALLIIVIFLLIFRWRRLRETRLLYFAAFIFGLALGAHHATVGVTLPALAVVAFRTEGLRLFKSKQLLHAALISFAALVLIYAYLPLAAARSPIINWGDPRTLQRIWWHVSGRQYHVFMMPDKRPQLGIGMKEKAEAFVAAGAEITKSQALDKINRIYKKS
jgi:hypothetical protein